MKWGAAAVAAILLAGVVASGVQVVARTHEVRELHQALEASRRHQDLLAAEHSRLLLERGARSAYYNVEHLAETKLGMRFPDRVERLPR